MEEKILYKSRTHSKYLFNIILIQVFLLVLHILLFKYWPETGNEGIDKWGPIVAHSIILILEIYYVVVPILKWYNNVFIVTNYRVKDEWGILYKNSKEIDLKNIGSIQVERGILDRIFGSGTLIFYGNSSVDFGNRGHNKNSSSSKNSVEHSGVKFKDVPKVNEVEAAINKLRRKRQAELNN